MVSELAVATVGSVFCFLFLRLGPVQSFRVAVPGDDHSSHVSHADEGEGFSQREGNLEEVNYLLLLIAFCFFLSKSCAYIFNELRDKGGKMSPQYPSQWWSLKCY